MTARKLYRVPAFAAVVVALVAGLFLLGRVSDNATVSMGLTALWFGLVFLAAAALALRIRALLWPLAIGYAIVAVAGGVLVIAPTLIDNKVDEQIVTGAPASTPRAAGKPDANRSRAARPSETCRSPPAASPRSPTTAWARPLWWSSRAAPAN
jgi:hypothetical protein